ncbi:MAG TPA: DedA family protein [Rhizomicrobium sp.]|nr:DedA family protein [Rhizomicrobium sp.]
MTLNHLIDVTISFVQANQAWAAPIAFAAAFGESLALLSLLVPGTIMLIGMGAIIGASDLPFWPVWFAAACGAALGDWVSYWIGLRFENRIAHIWPLSRYPHLLPKAHAFFQTWGTLGVFSGRFLGPLRAFVPLVAGISEMPLRLFQMANVTSALLWAFVLLGGSAFGMKWIVGWLL